MYRNLIVDISNLAWVTYFSNKKEYDRDLLVYKILESISYVAGEYNVDGVLVAFDSPKPWRRDIFPGYKGKRDYDENADEVKEILIELKAFFNDHTNIPGVSVPKAESDDIIAIAVQMTENDHNISNVILSNDRDFFQLLNERTYLHSPRADQGGKLEYDIGMKDYDLFVKCIRGDTSDSILSAYPRVRETKLREAWEDPIEMMNLMNTVPKNKVKTVQELYDFNRELIDLTRQPADIKSAIEKELLSLQNGGNFDKAGILRFFGSHNMVKAKGNIASYLNLFKKRVKI